MAKQTATPKPNTDPVPPVDGVPNTDPVPPVDGVQSLSQSEAIRCLFQCVKAEILPGAIFQQRVYCSPVTGKNLDGTPTENASFSTSDTPSGVLELLVEQPELEGFFQSGKHFYVDITAVEAPAV